jgi:glycogen operon protein
LGGEFVRKNRDESDDSFYLIFNMYWEEQTFDIPRLSGGRTWKLVLATDPALTPAEITEDRLTVPRRTIAVLQSVKNDGTKKAQRKKAK